MLESFCLIQVHMPLPCDLSFLSVWSLGLLPVLGLLIRRRRIPEAPSESAAPPPTPPSPGGISADLLFREWLDPA